MIPVQHKVDGYKLDHISQYAPGTTRVVSNMTPRSSKLAQVVAANGTNKMVFFGLQYALIKMITEWDRDFFSQSKAKVMEAYTRRVKHYAGPDNCDRGIEAMGKLHDLGYLPLRVRALPEGVRVNPKVPIFVVENTHDDFFWLVNYTETYLSCNTWSACHAASLSEQYWLTSTRWAKTSGAPSHWPSIANHCFAARGHRGDEDAMLSAMAHMLFSIGTDTLWGIDGIEHYYHGNVEVECIGVSVNAFEHATASQRIAHFGSEKESLRDAVTRVYPRGIVSYVGDTQDLFGLARDVLPELKDGILARQPDSLGLCKFVLRPDSSRKSPREILLGYKVLPNLWDLSWENNGNCHRVELSNFELLEIKQKGFDAVLVDGVHYDLYVAHDCIWFRDEDVIPDNEIRGLLWELWDVFGGTVNDKGLRVLDSKVGIIYGEGITLQMQETIYADMVAAGWCVSNVLFGVGSWAFLKDASRDSYGMAVKATSSVVDGELVSMQKTPKTDTGTKHSAKGLIRVELVDGEYVAYDEQTPEQFEQGELKIVMENGHMLITHKFQDIRQRLGLFV